MDRKLGKLARSAVAVSAVVMALMSAGAASATAAPTSAPAPAPVSPAAAAFLGGHAIKTPWNSSLCLDQHLAADSSGWPTVPTTTVWLIPCHYQLNQLWYLEDLGGNTFRVRNWGTDWCLSAPENSGSKVFMEVCVSGVRKQIWASSPTVPPYGTLAVQRPDASCMYVETVRQLKVVPRGETCRGDLPSYTWYLYG